MSLAVNEQQQAAAPVEAERRLSHTAHSDDASSLEKQAGVQTAEAVSRIAGWKVYVMWVGIFLVSYVNGLDNNTMYAYTQAAASEFNSYQLYTALQTMQIVIIATGKFPIAKFSDIFGRAEGYMLALFLYVLGFIIVAASHGFATLMAGVVFYAFGSTGVQIMNQTLLADTVTTQWRGFAIGIVSLPYVINFAVAPRIVNQLAPFANPVHWRWGPGSFAIVVPVACAPVILALYLTQRKAKREGLARPRPYFAKGSYANKSAGQKVASVFSELGRAAQDFDLLGLFILAASFVLVLLAINLAGLANDGWQASHIIAMLVVGGSLLVILGLYEWLLAPRPVIRREFFLNKNVCLAAFFIGLFDFAAFYLAWVPAYTWVQITFDWNSSDATYFSNTQSLCLVVFGIMAGAIAAATKRFKWLLVFGCCIRLLGLGLMIRYRDAASSTVQVVFPQVLQGLGGGFMGILLQVGAQVSVKHQDVAIVTAFVLLWTEIGGACGTAILGSLQNHVLQERLTRYLAPVGATPAQISAAFIAPSGIFAEWPLGSPQRAALIQAWADYVHIALIVACALSAVPIVAACLLTDYKLGNTQNCVSDEPSTGSAPIRQDSNEDLDRKVRV